jgi:microcystin-dependent protein
MSTPFVGQIGLFGFSFAPKGWAFAAGQLLPISQNTALFSLLGTTYGGDGKSTFALPDLTGGITPLQAGQGPGLSLYDLGQTGGSETITLLQSEMPFHTHNINTTDNPSGATAPSGALLGQGASGFKLFLPGNTPLNQQLNVAQAISVAGNSLPHNNMQPYLTLNFCIALQGVFPPRT